MPERPCAEAGCPNPATYRGRCAIHNRAKAKAAWRPRIYDTKRWHLTRRKQLFDHPICQACDERLATDVDHIIPLSAEGDPWSSTNLQSLCHECHSRKTQKEMAA